MFLFERVYWQALEVPVGVLLNFGKPGLSHLALASLLTSSHITKQIRNYFEDLLESKIRHLMFIMPWYVSLSVVSVFCLSFVIQTNGLLQQSSQGELQLTTETQDYQDDSEDNSKRAYRFNSDSFLVWVCWCAYVHACMCMCFKCSRSSSANFGHLHLSEVIPAFQTVRIDGGH